MQHTSAAQAGKQFGPEYCDAPLPTFTKEHAISSKMDGGEDIIEGYIAKRRPRVLPDGQHPCKNLGPDTFYQTPNAPCSSEDSTAATCLAKTESRTADQLSLSGSALSSFPQYRRLAMLHPASCDNATNVDLDSELKASEWTQAYCDDIRQVVERAQLHKCGASCFKYASGQRICRHHVQHVVTLQPQGIGTPYHIRRDGKELRNVVEIQENDEDGRRGRILTFQQHPAETPSNFAVGVALRCNNDSQHLVRVPPRCVFDIGPLPSLGAKEHWAYMNRSEAGQGSRDVVLEPWSPPEERSDPDSLIKALTNELGYLFEDAISVGYYINEYTTKLNSTGKDVLVAARQLALRFVSETEEKQSRGETVPNNVKQSLTVLRRLAYMMERLTIKSGSEMAFPPLFGHLSFSSHVTFMIYLKGAVWRAMSSFERTHAVALQSLHTHASLTETLAALDVSKPPCLGRGWSKIRLADGQDIYEGPDGQKCVSLVDALYASRGSAVLQGRLDRKELDNIVAALLVAHEPEADKTKTQTTDNPEVVARKSSQYDDWLHRGDHPILKDLCWYVYSIWVYRVERPRSSNKRRDIESIGANAGRWQCPSGYVDINFAAHYTLASSFVQRIQIEPKIPQLEGFTTPPSTLDANRNAMVKLLLFFPIATARSTHEGEQVDPHELLHSGPTAGPNPFMAFARTWECHAQDLEKSAGSADAIFAQRLEMPSLWETREMQNLLLDAATSLQDLQTDKALQEDEAKARSDNDNRVTTQAYNMLVAWQVSRNLEAMAVARVCRKRRHHSLIQTAVDDCVVDALPTEGLDQELLEGVVGDDAGPEITHKADLNEPNKPVDVLSTEQLHKALRFHRERTTPFVRQLHSAGLLADMPQENDAGKPIVGQGTAAAKIEEGTARLAELLQRAAPLPELDDFSQWTAKQAAVFEDRNKAAKLTSDIDHITEHDVANFQHSDRQDESEESKSAQAFFKEDCGPRLVTRRLMHELKCPPAVPGQTPIPFELTTEQSLAAMEFAELAQIAWEQEVGNVPWEQRVCKQMLLLGQGGSGKTALIQRLFLPMLDECFGIGRTEIVAASHAQANAISTKKHRAITIHKASEMRVQSLHNVDMLPGNKKQALERRWQPKVALVIEECSMLPAKLLNMLMFRAMFGRRSMTGAQPDDYGETSQLFGRLPLVLLLGDFLQLKPRGGVALLDDLKERALCGGLVDVESQIACAAFRSIACIHELRVTKRFTDQALPALLGYIREADGTKPMPQCMRSQLLERALPPDGRHADLQTVNFKEGYMLGMYWEMVARCIVSRTHADAKRLSTPLYYCQSADQRDAQWITPRITHQLLTTPNLHETGGLHGLLPLHLGMKVRLMYQLCPSDGLVKETQGTILRIDLHPSDARRHASGYQAIHLTHLPQAVWVSIDNYSNAPLQEDLADAEPQFLKTIDKEAVNQAGSIVCVRIVQASFKVNVRLNNGADQKIDVTRWQLPLSHALIRTVCSSQGLTFRCGTVIDLRKNFGMTDDIHWLNIYVMLSRPTCLQNMLLLGLDDKILKLLERGPPERIRHEVQRMSVAAANRRAALTQQAQGAGWEVYL